MTVDDATVRAVMLCPHCKARLDVHDLVGPTRCGSCRLIVGPGRALPAETGAASHVHAAAGALANFARRAGASPVDPDVVTAALQGTAEELGIRVDRLRMIDYRQALARGGSRPSLAEVMATFGTWRTARDAASRP